MPVVPLRAMPINKRYAKGNWGKNSPQYNAMPFVAVEILATRINHVFARLIMRHSILESRTLFKLLFPFFFRPLRNITMDSGSHNIFANITHVFIIYERGKNVNI